MQTVESQPRSFNEQKVVTAEVELHQWVNTACYISPAAKINETANRLIRIEFTEVQLSSADWLFQYFEDFVHETALFYKKKLNLIKYTLYFTAHAQWNSVKTEMNFFSLIQSILIS